MDSQLYLQQARERQEGKANPRFRRMMWELWTVLVILVGLAFFWLALATGGEERSGSVLFAGFAFLVILYYLDKIRLNCVRHAEAAEETRDILKSLYGSPKS